MYGCLVLVVAQLTSRSFPRQATINKTKDSTESLPALTLALPIIMAFRNSKKCFEERRYLCGQTYKSVRHGVEQFPSIWVPKIMLLTHEKKHFAPDTLTTPPGCQKLWPRQGAPDPGPPLSWPTTAGKAGPPWHGCPMICNRQWVSVNEWSSILWGRNLVSKPLDTPCRPRGLRIISVSSTLTARANFPTQGLSLGAQYLV